MSSTKVYILGGHQTDFARNYGKTGGGLFEMMQDAVQGTLAATNVEPSEIETAHVGNFCGELFAGQGHLGGFFAALDPAFHGLPTARHEAACASGSVALLAAAAEIEAGRYDLACVVGVEQQRNVSGKEAADHLGAAAWAGREALEAKYPWPHLFSRLTEEYDRRYGIDSQHLHRIAEINFANARKNPNAQTRKWAFTPESFRDDDVANPIIEGRVRRQDCSQLTDGAAAVILASPEVALRLGARRNLSLEQIPTITGWGHRTATMLFDDKIERSRDAEVVFPEIRGAITDAFKRADIPSVEALSGIETHDCFTITEYMAIDHFGITTPGESWKAVEDGRIELGGALPINPSGGLIGAGHPVGATGVRMLLDAYKQVSGTAGDYQVAGAKTFATLNIGGTGTTAVSFVVGVD